MSSLPLQELLDYDINDQLTSISALLSPLTLSGVAPTTSPTKESREIYIPSPETKKVSPSRKIKQGKVYEGYYDAEWIAYTGNVLTYNYIQSKTTVPLCSICSLVNNSCGLIKWNSPSSITLVKKEKVNVNDHVLFKISPQFQETKYDDNVDFVFFQSHNLTLNNDPIEAGYALLMKKREVKAISFHSLGSPSTYYDVLEFHTHDHPGFTIIKRETHLHRFIRERLSSGENEEGNKNFGVYSAIIERFNGELPVAKYYYHLKHQYHSILLLKVDSQVYTAHVFSSTNDSMGVFIPITQKFITPRRLQDMENYVLTKFSGKMLYEGINITPEIEMANSILVEKMLCHTVNIFQSLDSQTYNVFSEIFQGSNRFINASVKHLFQNRSPALVNIDSGWIELGSKGVTSRSYILDCGRLVCIVPIHLRYSRKDYDAILHGSKAVQKLVNFTQVYVVKPEYVIMQAAQFTLRSLIEDPSVIVESIHCKPFKVIHPNTCADYILLNILFQFFMSSYIAYFDNGFSHRDCHLNNIMFDILPYPVRLVYLTKNNRFEIVTHIVTKVIDYGDSITSQSAGKVGDDIRLLMRAKYISYDFQTVYLTLMDTIIVISKINTRSFFPNTMKLIDVFRNVVDYAFKPGTFERLMPDNSQSLMIEQLLNDPENYIYYITRNWFDFPGNTLQKMPSLTESVKFLKDYRGIRLKTTFDWAKYIYDNFLTQFKATSYHSPVMLIETFISSCSSKATFLCSEEVKDEFVLNIVDSNSYSCDKYLSPVCKRNILNCD